MRPRETPEIKETLEALSRLVDCDDPLHAGAIDQIGAETYAGAEQNVPGRAVADLQGVLSFLLEDPDSFGRPDGAFGQKTQAALHDRIGYNAFAPDLFGMLADQVNLVVQHACQPPNAPRPAESPPANPAMVPALLLSDLPPFYCQADDRWGDRVLGGKRTFRKSGCAVTCMAMFGSWLVRRTLGTPEALPPDVLDDYFDTHNGYAKNADGTISDNIVWGTLNECVREQFGIDLRYKRIGGRGSAGRPPGELHRIAGERLHDGWPVIMRVQYKDPKKQYGMWFNHFVLAVGIDSDGHIQFFDPGYARGGDLSTGWFRTDPPADAPHRKHKGGYCVVALEHYYTPQAL